MTRRILAIHFLPVGHEAVILFDDSSFGRASGLIASKWRDVVETMVEYERERDFSVDLMTKIQNVLTGDGK